MNGNFLSGLRGRMVACGLVLAVAWAVSACGGGGGDDGPAPVPPVPPAPLAISIQAIEPQYPVEGQAASFTAVASGGQGVQLTYSWEFGDGQWSSDRTPINRYRAAGTYAVRLTVDDGHQHRAVATSSVIVDRVNAVMASASTMVPNLGQQVSFRASGQGLDPLSYAWDFGDGGTSAEKDPTHAFVEKGTYKVALTMTDGHGHSNPSTLQVNVMTDAPTLAFKKMPETIFTNSWGEFIVEPNLTGDRLLWDFGDGSKNVSTSWTVQHQFTKAGSYVITVVKTDPAGQTATVSATVTVKNPPAPSGVTISSNQLVVGESALLKLTGYAGSNYLLDYAWDFGDGTRAAATGQNHGAEHRYEKPGSYVVTLTVTDTFGQSATATATIGVGAAQMLHLLAGADLPSSSVDGAGKDARFRAPTGMAFDAAGDLYIADTDNQAIRRMKPDGSVSTVISKTSGPAPSCTANDGNAIYNPSSVGFDGQGNLLVLVACSSWIVQIASDGAITRRGVYDPLSSDRGRGMVVDRAGNTYIVVAGSAIQKMSPTGETTIFAGNPKLCEDIDGVGKEADFCFKGYASSSLAIDGDDNLYAITANAVRKVTPDGTVRTLTGSWNQSGYVDGPAIDARFGNLTSIAVDKSRNVYLADSTNNVVRKLSASGEVTTVSDPIRASASPYESSISIAVDATGTVFLADAKSQLIRKLNPGRTWTTVAGREPNTEVPLPIVDGLGSQAAFFRPTGVVQGRSGNFYVADSDHSAIRKITPEGMTSTLARIPYRLTTVTTLGWPLSDVPSLGALAVDEDENVYVADAMNSVIRKIAPNGAQSVVAGTEGLPGKADGPANIASFNHPMGIAIDAARNLYVADTFNHSVRKISAEGEVTTIAGRPLIFGATNGAGTKASFRYPTSLVVDGQGRLFVADSGNNIIRKIMPDGTVSTVMGRAGETSVNRSRGVYSRSLSSLALDSGNGNLFFVDEASNTINVMMPDDSVHGVVGGGEGRISTGDLPGQLRSPRGVAVTADHQLVITSANAVLITSGF